MVDDFAFHPHYQPDYVPCYLGRNLEKFRKTIFVRHLFRNRHLWFVSILYQLYPKIAIRNRQKSKSRQQNCRYHQFTTFCDNRGDFSSYLRAATLYNTNFFFGKIFVGWRLFVRKQNELWSPCSYDHCSFANGT